MSETVVLEPERVIGEGCCPPGVGPRLDAEQSQSLAALFKALADPARVQILDILSQHAGQVCACDFEGMVGVPDPVTGERPKQSTISHHLKVLRQAGLIGAEKRGLWVYYFVHRERLTPLLRLLALVRGEEEGEVAAPSRRDCC